ncbi:SWIM zinc finger family protein [Meiothermus hypogaeus]|uniref:SWIM-type domain-containing protein n=2 Tax=Meiothermus hypogaeus TaxID=884155 RepID=A0A511QZV3_9DEIN|nr:SWIM zinc finger family protein [Meiothermus hypogaeus]RIH77338.1 hypothetical protein Mhypo_02047 [Meiothermus hypogaeus]GEM82901.1 hypothetical protein MHY01S_10670 [Meiothermus hypogaeus NBRC 106114]
MRLELESLLALADERVLERGKTLFLRGAVLEAARSRNRLQARVQGSAPFPYRVEIDLNKGEWRCSCPYTWGPVCKHLVAVAFAALEAPEIFARKKLGRSTPVNLKPLLELSDDELLRFLWQLAEERPELMEEFAYNLMQRYE